MSDTQKRRYASAVHLSTGVFLYSLSGKVAMRLSASLTPPLGPPRSLRLTTGGPVVGSPLVGCSAALIS